MTTAEAAEKIAKLLALSRSNNNPHEAESARRRAQALMDEHKLTPEDLEAGDKAAAFDEIIVALESYIETRTEIPRGMFTQVAAVRVILTKLKSLNKIKKAARLDQVLVIVSLVEMVGFKNATLNEINTIINNVLSKYNVKGTQR